MKRFTPLTLIAASALVLTACSGDNNPYDEPEELSVAMATDHYNTVANETYGPHLSMEEFETRAKDVCDRLRDNATSDDYDRVIWYLEDQNQDMHHNAVVALVMQGSGRYCYDKFKSAHPD